MDQPGVLAAFDEQMRRHPVAAPGVRIEVDEHVTRTIGVEFITGDLRATDLGISHVADNIVLMRYAEYSSSVIKVIGCLKKRLGGFQPELRELTISSDGIHVSERLSFLRGILSGIPAFAIAADGDATRR